MKSCTPLLLVLLLISPATAQTDMSALSHWAEGPALALAHLGDTVYQSHGGYLELLDVADPAAPSLISRYGVKGLINGLEVSGGVAYVVTEGRGIHLLDVSDPSLVAELSFLPVTDYLTGMAVQGDRLYYASSSAGQGLIIVDVGDPAAPVQVGEFLGGYYSVVCADGDFVYAGTAVGELQVIDTHDPALPVVVGTIPALIGKSYTYVGCAGGRLYAALRDFFGFHSLRIYDISAHTDPVELGWTAEGEVMTAGAVGGSRFFAADSDQVVVYDAADPTQIEVLGTVGNQDRARSLACDGDLVYVGEEDSGLRIFSVPAAEPWTDPVEIGAYNDGFYGAVTDVVLAGGLLYAACTAPMLVIYDAAQTAAPAVVGSLYEHVPGTTDRRAYSVHVQGDHAYLRGSDDTGSWLKVVDVSDPAAPVEVAEIPGRWSGIAFRGSVGYLFGSDGGYSIRAFEFADPSVPVPGASLALSAAAAHGVDGDRLVVAVADDLWIYDIGDPAQITELGHADLAWSANMQLTLCLHCADGLATVVTADGGWHPDGMRVVDYAIPGAPAVHAAAGPADRAWDIVSDGGYLYMSLDRSGVEMFSLADPASPARVGSFPTGYASWGLAGDGRGLFIADTFDGIFVVQNDLVVTGLASELPAAGRSLRNFPNPFNPRTAIVFRLDERRTATLEVLDARGRLVRTLAQGVFAAGAHEVMWDGRSDDGRAVPSGVYFSNLRTDAGTRRGEMVLVR